MKNLNDFTYWPYDEVTISISDSKSGKESVEVKAPWVFAKVSLDGENLARAQIISEKLAAETLSQEDLPLINWFFQKFSNFPFCYILPTIKSADAVDVHQTLDNENWSKKCSAQASILASYQDDCGEPASSSSEEWTWSTEAALNFSTTGVDGLVHPESLFSVVRRFHLLDVISLDGGVDIFSEIKTFAPDDFKRAASILVRQNHYVTKQCQLALSPAIQIAGHGKQAVQSFVKEEHGHDLILGAALKSMGLEKEDVPVAENTKNLMTLLQYAATTNFLGFAMAVDFFERSTYEDFDPLARLLEFGGFEKAARQINRHKDINDAGGHENVACGFLRTMAPCSRQYAQQAVHIAELISSSINRVSSAAFQLYLQTK